MRRHTALVVAALLVVAAVVAAPAGAQAPGGDGPPTAVDAATWLEDPEMTGEGQQPPHAVLRPFRDVAGAAAGPRAQTSWTRSLDGAWRFAYADRPQDAPVGFHGVGYDASRWDTITVPGVWQQAGYGHPIYRNVSSEIAPYDPPRVPDDLNPVGSYVRTFDVPASWDGRRTLLRFEGVTSGYFVWVNGQYAGYDQGGMTPAEFDVTDAVRRGRNTVAVQVFRWGSGAYLENFDMWHLSGIFRSVWAYSVPATRIQDVTIRTAMTEATGDLTAGDLTAGVEVAAAAGGTQGAHTIRGALVDPRDHVVARLTGAVEVGPNGGTATLAESVRQPLPWTDETPNLYTLVLELVSPDGDVTHVTSERLGFRQISVAEEQVRINGVPVDFRGVNRHEHDPRTGRHVPRERMLQDVRLLKRHNINAVRTSHYPNDPRWYDLADEYGLWLNDEVDVETHFRENCPSNCLADRPEWRAAMLDRFTAMVERDKNHPSVFMWSTGNEAGLGAAHFAMAEYADQADPTRLLYHQSNNPNGDAPYADVWGPRYPSPAGLQQIAANTNRPVIMGEWLHAMGNSLGHYEDMWQTIRREPALQGGFVWDWVDQGLQRPVITTPDSSGNRIAAHLAGNPQVIEDRNGGQALFLSGLDDWVEAYRDPRLDITDNTLTLDAWVKPDEDPVGDFSIVSKGDRSYALEMQDADTVEFFIYDGGWVTVTADVPAGWAGTWHRLTGVYDGTALRLFIDGQQVGERAYSGNVDWTEWPVNVGRNAEKHGDSWAGRTGNGAVDDIRVYDRALTPEEIAADPAGTAVLALDFDTVRRAGTYHAYGSSPFVLNGLVLADRTPQPELAQMAYSHAWIRFADVDAAAGQVRLTNDRRFTDLSGVEIRWAVTEAGRTLARGTVRPRLAPGGSAVLQLPVPPPGDVERWLDLDAVLTRPTSWAPRGHVLASEQFPAGGDQVPSPSVPQARGPLQVSETADRVELSGSDFSYIFDRAEGTFTQMRSRGKDLVTGGPLLDVWRPPIGNEWANWGQAEGRLFWALGLDRLQTTIDAVTVEQTAPAQVRITVEAHSEAPDVSGQGFAQRYVYDVDAAGTVHVAQQVEAYGNRMRSLPWLPRVGFALRMPQRFDTFTWYGRGPGETYVDRRNAEHMGVWRGDVDDQVFEYLPPQETGNKTDTRWAAVSDGTVGLLAAGDLEVSVDRYATQRDRATYPMLLKRDPFLTFRVDKAVSGVGDTPVPTQPQYRVRPDEVHMHEVVLRPLTRAEARNGILR
jgi:beta-galactosidase